jgi:ferredoxin
MAHGEDEISSHEVNHPPQRVPLSHQHLIDRLHRRFGKAKVGLASVPFADVTVDEQACSAYGLCAFFCPTAALHFGTSVYGFAIHFRPDHCINCDLCKVACPEDAIRIDESVNVVRLMNQEGITLVEGELAACSVCGAEIAQRNDNSLYHSCRHGAGRVTSLHDGADLMADLLSRLTLPS